MDSVERALSALKNGEIILVYDADNRERETDMVIASEFVRPEDIRALRKDAGGLICTTLPPWAWKKLGIPYLVEIIEMAEEKYPWLKGMRANDLAYDERSAFGLTINHRKTFTGITDKDRALTVRRLGEFIKESEDMDEQEARERFGKEFRSPGHIHLLNARDGLLDVRFGHTELTTSLALMAGLSGSTTICEMMGNDGNALSKEDAGRYAEEHGYVFIEGKEIIEAWKNGKSDCIRRV
jgi:3,4-dihydroxy 2-butanone 4-phosphate synthase